MTFEEIYKIGEKVIKEKLKVPEDFLVFNELKPAFLLLKPEPNYERVHYVMLKDGSFVNINNGSMFKWFKEHPQFKNEVKALIFIIKHLKFNKDFEIIGYFYHVYINEIENSNQLNKILSQLFDIVYVVKNNNLDFEI